MTARRVSCKYSSMKGTRRNPMISILLVCVTAMGVAALGTYIARGRDADWYASLAKSPLTPPDIVFQIIWPILFMLMALGAALVRVQAGWFMHASPALGVYFTQLSVILSWLVMFFLFHEITIALGLAALLWVLILTMMAAFAQHSRLAVWLQVPYFLWVSFALYLNAYLLMSVAS